jgi:hypothetical protein
MNITKNPIMKKLPIGISFDEIIRNIAEIISEEFYH